MTLAAVLDEPVELVDIIAEYKNDLHKAALSSTYFDVKTRTADGRIITLDLQRRYAKERVRNRTIYYACREIADQVVERGKYENLQSVIVMFILTEAPLKHTTENSKIQLRTVDNELYSDLLTIHEINLRHISEQHLLELQTLKSFFEADTAEKYHQFLQQYGELPLGKLLEKKYDSAVRESTLLDTIREDDKFMIRLTDEERLLERQEGKTEGKVENQLLIATNLLRENMPFDFIARVTGLSLSEITSLHATL